MSLFNADDPGFDPWKILTFVPVQYDWFCEYAMWSAVGCSVVEWLTSSTFLGPSLSGNIYRPPFCFSLAFFFIFFPASSCIFDSHLIVVDPHRLPRQLERINSNNIRQLLSKFEYIFIIIKWLWMHQLEWQLNRSLWAVQLFARHLFVIIWLLSLAVIQSSPW